MALQLILGNAGAGKSHYIFEKIIQESMEHPTKQYLIIVPEQFTMQTQKDLVMMHPRHGIMNIDVLSFERLAHRVFSEAVSYTHLLISSPVMMAFLSGICILIMENIMKPMDGTILMEQMITCLLYTSRAESGNSSLIRNSLLIRGSVWQTYPTAGSISCTFPLNRPHRCQSSGNARSIRRLRKPVLSSITPTSVPTPIIGCQGCRKWRRNMESRSKLSILLTKNLHRMYLRQSRPMLCFGTRCV